MADRSGMTAFDLAVIDRHDRHELSDVPVTAVERQRDAAITFPGDSEVIAEGQCNRYVTGRLRGQDNGIAVRCAAFHYLRRTAALGNRHTSRIVIGDGHCYINSIQ